ncbi:MAG: iron ABC transporter permease [Phycisphaeraceae bacterium]|nr:iron ABC transporter permease [Phycisphaeraceae bacterium]
MSRLSLKIAWLLIGVVLLSALLARLFVGSTGFGWPGGESAGILLDIRIQRGAVAAIVGIALGVSGVALQALLRNPLAEPYILGLSTGAGLGILVEGYLAMQIGLAATIGGFGALAGTAATLGIVYLASRRRGVIDRLGLLLVGVVLATINGALIMLLNYLVGPGVLRDNLMNWMMGVLPPRELGWQDGLAAGVCGLGLVLLLWQGKAMDIATLDDDEAASLGIHTNRLKTLLLLTASVLTATAVLIAGPIAFIGLIAPHLARLLLGPTHRPLLIGAAMLGAALLIFADTASDAVAAVYDGVGLIPIGIFTAILGGPVFLWMLRPQLGRGIE